MSEELEKLPDGEFLQLVRREAQRRFERAGCITDSDIRRREDGAYLATLALLLHEYDT